ncbi:hypothetical protein [Pseudomonas brassicacearum]|uniref:hypothetical protein n=1 Tax=Pseudomonas brassicacearum TaxID=930166 RepID=UPI0011AF1A40|nr:hypothetical protein [Pseudomonas brassicacearum]
MSVRSLNRTPDGQQLEKQHFFATFWFSYRINTSYIKQANKRLSKPSDTLSLPPQWIAQNRFYRPIEIIQLTYKTLGDLSPLSHIQISGNL